MRRWAAGSLASAAIAIGCGEEGPLVRAGRGTAVATRPDVAAVVEGNNVFALELYDRLRERDGNLFFSPYSISVALAMTYAGARGETAAEMRKVLHFTLPQERLHHALAKLAAQEPRGCELHVANRLWGQRGCGFLESFLKLTEEHYGAPLQQVDFAGATEEARREINAWVAEKTRDRIRELISPGILDPLTRLVLTNAIYFKSDWAHPFSRGNTMRLPFHLPGGRDVRVPMMYRTRKFNYASLPGLKVLELPYSRGELSMFVLLPADVDGLAGLEGSLSRGRLRRWLSRLRRRKIHVFLPRFRTTCSLRLKDVLRSMGMRLAFIAGAADLSGMTGEKELFISHVLHKAFVDVNEEGTEAAAATAVVTKGIGPRIERFLADHPFLFLIRDNRSGSILFLGRVVNPRE